MVPNERFDSDIKISKDKCYLTMKTSHKTKFKEIGSNFFYIQINVISQI
jgi:hypothetical protein